MENILPESTKLKQNQIKEPITEQDERPHRYKSPPDTVYNILIPGISVSSFTLTLHVRCYSLNVVCLNKTVFILEVCQTDKNEP